MKNQIQKKRILTGDRPTGRLHLGHYIGSLQNRVHLQHEYETYILVADVQALTDNFEHPENIERNVRQVVMDYLTVGIDPNISTIVIQSQVPEICELTIYYMNLVTLARAQRNPTVKDEIKQKGFGSLIPLGFLAYPISQAADITIFQADLVPVGDDQLPMIEQTREIVERFNSLYGKTLVKPEALLGKFPRLPGTDGGAKMGKSLGNVIDLSETPDTLRKKVMNMYTDPTRIHPTDPGHVEGNPVFVYHEAFNSNKELVEDLKARYRDGKVGDVEVKERLFEALDTFLEPIREKRKHLENEPAYVSRVMREGTEKGRNLAVQTIKMVRRALRIAGYY